ncbi:MAG: hypothetical protein CSA94_01755 [Bacteroidetes bacterium]|nr:MAG: hypothetical protein CSA94_01755 [Bacteroidota bacterium]
MILLKTDIVGVIFLIIYILFTFTVMITPSILTFLLYKFAKKKNKVLKIISLCFFIGVTIFMSYQSYKLITEDEKESFGPKYETVEIPQKIGGVLICESLYTADFHSWDYNISYCYKENDSLYQIGTARYSGEKWKKDEQFVKYGNWLLLKVSNSSDSDKLIIFNIITKETNEFIVSPETIESNIIWKSENIRSQLNYSSTISKIIDVNTNGVFKVEYVYRKEGRTLFDKHGEREIVYKVDAKNGIPRMVEIKKM